MYLFVSNFLKKSNISKTSQFCCLKNIFLHSTFEVCGPVLCLIKVWKIPKSLQDSELELFHL